METHNMVSAVVGIVVVLLVLLVATGYYIGFDAGKKQHHLKRYILFGYNSNCPKGGWRDYVGDANDAGDFYFLALQHPDFDRFDVVDLSPANNKQQVDIYKGRRIV